MSIQAGDTMILYEDEDPAIRWLFESECARNGAKADMPAAGTRAE